MGVADDFPHRFRMRLLPWLVIGFAGTHLTLAVLFGVPLALAGFRPPPGGWGPPLLGYAVVSVAGMAWLVLGMWGYVWWFRVRVGPTGVRGYDFWSLPLAVPWAAVTATRPLNVGVTFLRVRADTTRRVLWLPLFVTDPRGLADRLTEYAGPDHPLTRAARDRVDPTDD